MSRERIAVSIFSYRPCVGFYKTRHVNDMVNTFSQRRKQHLERLPILAIE